MKAQLAEPGATGLSGSCADFDNLIAAGTAKWAKVVVKLSSAKPD
jgi:hypothetical protein